MRKIMVIMLGLMLAFGGISAIFSIEETASGEELAVPETIAGETTFATTIPEIAPMFDGNEKLIGIISVPVYVRQVFLP